MLSAKGGAKMLLFQKMYFHLFNCVTDAIALLSSEKHIEAKERLERAQTECEELYVEQGNEVELAKENNRKYPFFD